jgi:ketosteroid isomerase-like protein
MRRVTAFCTLAIAMTSLGMVHGAEDKGSHDTNIEKDLIKLQRELVQALPKRDASAFDRIEADDFVFTDPEGTLRTKSQDIEALKSSSIQSAEADDMKVRLYGDAAVVTGRLTCKGTYGGKDITGQYRFTDTWINQEGKWRCVACSMSILRR